jgi:hypothetical protein
MMAMMPHRASSGSAREISGAACCQRSSQPFAPATVQTATERLATYAIASNERGDAVLLFVPTHQLPIDRRTIWPNRHSRASLCTFLI